MFSLLFINTKIIRLFLFYEQEAFNTKYRKTNGNKLNYYDNSTIILRYFFIINV